MNTTHATNRRYRKDCLRLGRFVAREAVTGRAVELEVSAARLDGWVAAFGAMRAGGVEVDLTVDHGGGAASRRGWVTALYRASTRGDALVADPEGEVLAFEAELSDDEAVLLAQRCPHVSVEIEPDFIDGQGRRYGEAITAISIVRQPVVPGQRPFSKLAAGRNRSAECLLLGTADELTHRWPQARPGGEPTPDGDHAMFNEQQMQRQCRLLEMGEPQPPESLGERVLERIELALRQRDQARTALEARGDGADAATASPDNDIDGELMEEAAENCRERLDRLIERGRISPAAGQKLAEALLGEAGARPAVCLSRRAAVRAGFDRPLARAVLEALAENQPVHFGERTGAQLMTLSRREGSGREAGGGDADDPDALTRRMIEQANRGGAGLAL